MIKDKDKDISCLPLQRRIIKGFLSRPNSFIYSLSDVASVLIPRLYHFNDNSPPLPLQDKLKVGLFLPLIRGIETKYEHYNLRPTNHSNVDHRNVQFIVAMKN